METTDRILAGIAQILWPIIVVVVILRFRPAVTAIIESAQSRKFALKIGGQELTMEEANQGQQKLITDLQLGVAEMQKQVGEIQRVVTEFQKNPVLALPADHSETTAHLEAPHRARHVLWVDDNPKNISYLLVSLRELGVQVDEAKTTAEGLERFSTRLAGRKRYDYVLSDMRRVEDGIMKDTAGLELLEKVRKLESERNVEPKVPFIFFTGDGSITEHGDDARRLGVTEMTSSPTKLIGMLNAETLKPPRPSALGA